MHELDFIDKMTQLRSKWLMSIGPVSFSARETFSSSVLPTKKEVVERMIWFLTPRPKGSGFGKCKSKSWAASQVAGELYEHWVWCNVYPKHPKNVSKSVEICRKPLFKVTNSIFFYSTIVLIDTIYVGYDLKFITFRKYFWLKRRFEANVPDVSEENE